MRKPQIKKGAAKRCIALFLMGVLSFSVAGCEKKGDADVADAAYVALPDDLPNMQFSVPQEYASADDFDECKIISYCISPEGMVFASLNTGGVIQIDTQGDVVKSYSVDAVLYNLVMLGGTLYGYAYVAPGAADENGAIVAVQTGTGAVKMHPFAYDATQVRAMAGYAGELLMLCTPDEETRKDTTDDATGRTFSSEQLVTYNIAKESHTIIDSDAITVFASLGNGRVLLYGFDGKSYLAEMDMRSMEIGKKTYNDYMGNLSAVAQNTATGDLFFRTSGRAGVTGVFADMPSRQITLFEEATPRTCNDLRFRDGYVFVLDVTSGMLHRNKVVAPSKETVTLQIDQSFSDAYGRRVNSYGWSDWAREYRTQTGNNVSGVDRFSSLEQFVAELLSGSDKIDGFIISLADAYSLGIFEQGAFYPMQSDALDSFSDKAFDWVSDAMTLADGSYWALPVFLDAQKIYYSPSKMAEYNLDVSIFDSYDSTLATAEMLLDERKNGLCNAEIAGTLFMAYDMVNQYFITRGPENTEFDTPEFREAMDTLKMFYGTMRDENFDYRFRIVAPFSPTMQDVVFTMNTDDMPYYNAVLRRLLYDEERSNEIAAYESMLVLPTPRLGGNADMPSIMDVDVLIINPNSKNKEEVLRFAECAANMLVAPVREDINAPMVSMFFEDKDVYQNVYNVGSAQFESLYQYYSNGAVQSVPMDVRNYLFEFGTGKATAEDTIFAITRYMEMRLKERQ